MEPKRTIILASASPRRKELLQKIGLSFQVDPSAYPENPDALLTPEELVKSHSQGKAAAVAVKYRDAIIIAADTIGVIRNKIIGKPGSTWEARQMLQLLSGRSHRVITGFTILDTNTGRQITRTVETRVYFKKLSPQEISGYVATGEPMDKAGAYGIQGLGAVIVTRIIGDYYNVIGMPLSALAECLREFGIEVLREAKYGPGD